MYKILIVDDDPVVASEMESSLRCEFEKQGAGYGIFIADNLHSAMLQIMQAHGTLDLISIDGFFPEDSNAISSESLGSVLIDELILLEHIGLVVFYSGSLVETKAVEGMYVSGKPVYTLHKNNNIAEWTQKCLELLAK